MARYSIRSGQRGNLSGLIEKPPAKSSLLEGEYAKRRMAYFSNLKDIKTKKAELVQVLKQFVELNT